MIGSPYRESESSLAGKKVENIYLRVNDMGDYTEIFRGGYEEIAEVATRKLIWNIQRDCSMYCLRIAEIKIPVMS